MQNFVMILSIFTGYIDAEFVYFFTCSQIFLIGDIEPGLKTKNQTKY